MKSPYGLDIIDSCLNCKLREDHLFCNLSPEGVATLNRIKSTATYPKGAVLFVEGQDARGVFILCNGRAKLSTSSSDGKTIILKIAGPGEVLGLSAAVSGKPYEVSVEIMEPCQANFLPSDRFLEFLRNNGEAALRIAQQLSQNYHSAYNEIKTLGLSGSAAEKLAKLLLEWATTSPKDRGEKMHVTLTHEEIAQLIGTSRETVTRVFADFKRKRLIDITGATLTIRDKKALQEMVTTT